MRVAAALAALLAMLLVTSGAQASQRYASPTGSGTTCSQAAPCELKEAVGKAESNDEVIVTTGTYTLAAGVAPAAGKTGIDIHGAMGQAAPKLVATLSGSALQVGSGNRLSQVEVENTANFATGISCGEAAQVDRVRILVTGETSWAIQQGSTCAVRDSLLRAEGKKSTGLLSSGGQETVLARNLTVAVGGAESIGVSSEGFGLIPGGVATHLLDLKNSIVHAGGADLASNFFFFPGPPFTIEAAGNIAVSNSNFVTSKSAPGSAISEGAGNQKAAPNFIDAAAGNYREAGGSPTIDGGVADQLGALDLDGNARVMGVAPDIGAYEFVPPAPAGGIRAISIKPRRFRARRSGGSVVAGILKSKPPVGSLVTYTMSGPATVEFSVSRKIVGRKVGKRCKRQTHANAGRPRCVFFVPVKGSFTQAGATGSNSFVFSGRIGGRKLKHGSYALSAYAGHLVSAPFEIGGLRRRHRGG